MSELHKEWDRTGATKASVLISLEEVEEVNKTLVATIMKRQEQADKAIDFKECVRLSKENYIPHHACYIRLINNPHILKPGK